MMNRFTFISSIVCAFFLGCEHSPPRQSIQADISNLSTKIDNLNLRLTRIEKVVGDWGRTIDDLEKNFRQSKADQLVTIEDLRTELKSLNGSTEVLRHDLSQFSQENQRVKEDFDVRLLDLEKRLSDFPQRRSLEDSSPTKRRTSHKSFAGNVDDITRYDQILRIFRDKKDYMSAAEQFRAFIQDYPKSSLVANAQFWIGESYFAKGDYTRAIAEFQVVLDQYPHSEKVCDALFKQGIAFLELKEPQKARLFLTETQKRCPKTPTATRAREKLLWLAGQDSKK